MTAASVVAMFPGQGSHVRGALKDVAHHHAIKDILDATDHVGRQYGIGPVSRLLTDEGAPDDHDLVPADPDLQILAIFAAATAAHALLTVGYGIRPDVLLGHSFGEIAALTAANGLTVEDGAEVVCLRSEALRSSPPPEGGMLAIGLAADRVQQLLAGAGLGGLELAVASAPRQSVVSGPHHELARLASLAKVLDLPAGRIPSPYPYHNRMCAGAAQAFAVAIEAVPVRPMSARLYSSRLGGFYPDSTAAKHALPELLVTPARHVDAIRRLHAHGADAFVECGIGSTLTKLVRATVPDVTTGAVFGGPSGSPDLDDILRSLPARERDPALDEESHHLLET